MATLRTLALALALAATAARAPAAHATPAALADGTLSDVAEKVVDGVVNVSSTKQVDLGPAAFDPFFNDPSSPFYLAPDQRQQASLGSGVIVSASGRVITNAHVIDGADQIAVKLSDGTELSAKLVGIDRRSDVAVLQLEGDLPTLHPLAFGDSSKMRLGEVVLAVGDPFGVGQTVTMGIVSAKGRAQVGIEDYEDFIQTDAAINPGNSGGALVNLRGELIGINTAILSRSGGYQGVGFAIPSNMARPIVDMLVKDGKVSRSYLGVGFADLTREVAKAKHIAATRGVLVAQIVENSPAARAGLKLDDVIIAVDGAPVTNGGQLRNTIAMKPIGAVKLEVVRGSRSETLTATLVAAPDPAVAQRAPAPRVPAPPKTRHGH
jgi:Do/DeqQ family serine protease